MTNTNRGQPIQRVCKYPLLFEDLCRHTPVYDDPEAHAELEKALFRLQETIREVNKAKDDPKTRRLIEISWQLQDRLVFKEQVRRNGKQAQLWANSFRHFLALSSLGFLVMFLSVVCSTSPIRVLIELKDSI
jgi:hypothetical protein